jgi:RNA polymerase sigma factor (sigma-70 family)
LQLTHYTSGVTGNLEVAREIVQESFMRFWKTEDKKIPVDMEKPWLYRVCRNLAIDHLRRQGVVIAVGDSSELEKFSTPVELQTDYSNDDMQAIMLTKLSELSANQQEVLRLRYQHDMSYKEISGVTGHSVSNVGVIVHEAMRKLKKMLSKSESANQQKAFSDD